MKKQKKTTEIRSPGLGDPGRARRTRAFVEALEWGLDVAHALARRIPEEIDAVERVRAFVRCAIAGRPGRVPIDDLIVTLALVFGAIDRKMLRDLVDDLDESHAFELIRHHLVSRVRLPSARELWERAFPHYLVSPAAWQRSGHPVAHA